jgi:hypothetical protein
MILGYLLMAISKQKNKMKKAQKFVIVWKGGIL